MCPLPLLLQRRHDKLFCVPRTYLQRNATQYAYGIYQGYVLAARSRSGRRVLVWRPSWPFISVSDCLRREPQLATICSSDCMRRLRAPDSPLSLRGCTVLDHPGARAAAARVAAFVAAPHHRPGRGRLVLRARLRLVRHRHAHLRDAAGPSLLSNIPSAPFSCACPASGPSFLPLQYCTPLSTPIPFFPLQSPSTPCQLLLPRL